MLSGLVSPSCVPVWATASVLLAASQVGAFIARFRWKPRLW